MLMPWCMACCIRSASLEQFNAHSLSSGLAITGQLGGRPPDINPDTVSLHEDRRCASRRTAGLGTDHELDLTALRRVILAELLGGGAVTPVLPPRRGAQFPSRTPSRSESVLRFFRASPTLTTLRGVAGRQPSGYGQNGSGCAAAQVAALVAGRRRDRDGWKCGDLDRGRRWAQVAFNAACSCRVAPHDRHHALVRGGDRQRATGACHCWGRAHSLRGGNGAGALGAQGGFPLEWRCCSR